MMMSTCVTVVQCSVEAYLRILQCVLVYTCIMFSPTEEDSVQVERGGPVMDEVSASTRRDNNCVLDGSDRQMFVDIGTTILMARCCATVPSGKQLSADGAKSSHGQPGSLQECEIFQPIRPQVS